MCFNASYDAQFDDQLHDLHARKLDRHEVIPQVCPIKIENKN